MARVIPPVDCKNTFAPNARSDQSFGSFGTQRIFVVSSIITYSLSLCFYVCGSNTVHHQHHPLPNLCFVTIHIRSVPLTQDCVARVGPWLTETNQICNLDVSVLITATVNIDAC